MNVTCPNCATIYRVDPAKVPEAGVRARCSVCSAVFAVRHDAAVTSPPLPRPAPSPPAASVSSAPASAHPAAAAPPVAAPAPPAPAVAAPAMAPPAAARPAAPPAAPFGAAPPPGRLTSPGVAAAAIRAGRGYTGPGPGACGVSRRRSGPGIGRRSAPSRRTHRYGAAR